MGSEGANGSAPEAYTRRVTAPLHDSHERLLAAAQEAVALASAVCRQVQRGLDRVRAITKDDKSPVTVADFASQAVVSHTLSARLGHVVLVGEESSSFLRDPAHAPHLAAAVEAAQTVWPDVTPDALLRAIDDGGTREAPASRTFWTLDPVDGTKGFLRGQQYAVALAFIESGLPVVGVLGCPNLPPGEGAIFDVPHQQGAMLSAIHGRGTIERPCDADAPAMNRPVHHAPRPHGSPVRACESAEAAHSDHSSVSSLMAALGPAGAPARLDSQCKYAVVARGQADIYLRMPSKKLYLEKIWDHAAGALIAQEAGCTVTDVRGKPLDFTRGTELTGNRGIVVAPPSLHARAIEAISRLGLAPNA